jgi:hypothetical protein
MRLLVLATISQDGRPITGAEPKWKAPRKKIPSTAPDSVRFTHIARRPQVSATHLPGEEWSVTVHGTAVPRDHRADTEFRQTLLDIYTPRYGADWGETFLDRGPLYARIDAAKMFAFAV